MLLSRLPDTGIEAMIFLSLLAFVPAAIIAFLSKRFLSA